MAYLHLAQFTDPALANVYDLGTEEGREWAALEVIDAPRIDEFVNDLGVSLEGRALLLASAARD